MPVKTSGDTKQRGFIMPLSKKGRKQFRRSLKTGDKLLAKRRLTGFLTELDRLMPNQAADLSFEQQPSNG